MRTSIISTKYTSVTDRRTNTSPQYVPRYALRIARYKSLSY